MTLHAVFLFSHGVHSNTHSIQFGYQRKHVHIYQVNDCIKEQTNDDKKQQKAISGDTKKTHNKFKYL